MPTARVCLHYYYCIPTLALDTHFDVVSDSVGHCLDMQSPNSGMNTAGWDSLKGMCAAASYAGELPISHPLLSPVCKKQVIFSQQLPRILADCLI